MSFGKRKKELLQSTEAKLAALLHELNSDSREEAGRLVCETECTMQRIRAYSDFLYLLRVKPIQTMCYYGAGAFFLLMLGAAWCREWLLTAIFGAIFLMLAFAPHNMRIHYFNKQADNMEGSYGKVINAEFGDEGIRLTISDAAPYEQELDENGDAAARRTAIPQNKESASMVIGYKQIVQAVECSHSFYLFPVDENKRRLDTIICDKTQFLCGTPMALRDMLARKCGKNFKIKTKKA